MAIGAHAVRGTDPAGESSSRVSAPWLLSDAIAGSSGSDTSSSGASYELGRVGSPSGRFARARRCSARVTSFCARRSEYSLRLALIDRRSRSGPLVRLIALCRLSAAPRACDFDQSRTVSFFLHWRSGRKLRTVFRPGLFNQTVNECYEYQQWNPGTFVLPTPAPICVAQRRRRTAAYRLDCRRHVGGVSARAHRTRSLTATPRDYRRGARHARDNSNSTFDG